jgi:hypothetical protein
MGALQPEIAQVRPRPLTGIKATYGSVDEREERWYALWSAYTTTIAPEATTGLSSVLPPGSFGCPPALTFALIQLAGVVIESALARLLADHHPVELCVPWVGNIGQWVSRLHHSSFQSNVIV